MAHTPTTAMSHKAEALAYDREKRVYKDAYVSNFRRVRYFPALATIGAGRSDGDSIILVQESAANDPTPRTSRRDEAVSSSGNEAPFDVSRRLCPPDSLDEIFETTAPLKSFRTTVLCKHTKARRDRKAQSSISSASDNQHQSSAISPSYYGIANEVRIWMMSLFASGDMACSID
ncbi:hypothetical protein ATCC90586_003827 [Pythium insidiosum]|nr:hypothetical protein ATCC90586_003827 [Pythium insidiosum]